MSIKPISMNNVQNNVIDRYKLLKKIGEGSFGTVYLVYDRTDKKKYACKVENSKSKNRLKGETHIYKYFLAQNISCVPLFHEYIETPEWNLLIMQLLGKSIGNIFEENNKIIDVGSVMKFAVTIIRHLETIHNNGFIHRDIKPDNCMFGLDDKNNELYLMDFGLSKKWYVIDNETGVGKHIDYKSDRSLIGTARYASIHVHMGIEASRRDDMESVGYMIVYLVKGSLVWQGLKKKTEKGQTDKICDKKIMTDLKVLCSGLPSCFQDYINYTRNLEFTDKPDYDYLVDLFEKSALKNGIQMEYFWNKDIKQKKKSKLPVVTNSNSNMVNKKR